jgi:hypothetical protein
MARIMISPSLSPPGVGSIFLPEVLSMKRLPLAKIHITKEVLGLVQGVVVGERWIASWASRCRGNQAAVTSYPA